MRKAKTKTRENFDELVERAASNGERIVVRRGRRRLCALLPIADLDFLEEIEDRIDLEDARAALRESENETTRISWEQLKSELGL